MVLERIFDLSMNLGLGAFAAAWIGLIVGAAASVPVVGFAVAIPAALVVYCVRAAVTGQAEARVSRMMGG